MVRFTYQQKSLCLSWRTLCVTALTVSLFASNRPTHAYASIESYGENYVVVVNATGEEYGSIYDALFNYANAEIVWINMEAFEPSESIGGGPPVQAPYIVFNAVFKIVAEPDAFHQFGLYKDDMLEMAAWIKSTDGEIVQLEAYTDESGVTRYSFIAEWFPGGSHEWEVMLDVSPEFYAAVAANYPNVVNYCLTETEFGAGRVSALFRDDNSYTASFTNPMSYGSLLTEKSEWEAQGYRMTSLEVINSYSFPPRYLPVFKKASGLSTTAIEHISTATASELAAHNEQEAAGMQPLLVATQVLSSSKTPGWGATPFFYGYWVGRPQRKGKWTAGGNQFLAPTYGGE